MNEASAKEVVPQLIMTRRFAAPRERVFAAWTEPEMFKKWFGPEAVSVSDVTIDLRVHGAYKITMQEPDGRTVEHGGTYVTITPPEKLAFTWVLDGQGCEGSTGEYAQTLVTLDFEERDGGTVLHLVHEQLPSKQSYEGHRAGWESTLDCLAQVL